MRSIKVGDDASYEDTADTMKQIQIQNIFNIMLKCYVYVQCHIHSEYLTVNSIVGVFLLLEKGIIKDNIIHKMSTVITLLCLVCVSSVPKESLLAVRKRELEKVLGPIHSSNV